MKVLLLNGSANKKGNTFTALTEVAKQLEKNGIESEIMQLGNKPVRGCIACGQCRMKELGHCVFDDDICNRIVEKLNEADALVVGSPVYYGQPNGALMAVLQRAFFSGANVQNKPAAAVAICRRGGASATYQTLNMMFEMMNMPVVTSQYWNIAYGMAPGEVAQDTEGMQTMRTMADNMAWLLKKIHANGTPDYPEREEWQSMNSSGKSEFMDTGKDTKWKILSTEYLIKRPWLTARRDKVELPDGRIIPEYYVLEYPDWVNVIAITKDGKYVMERQYRHALGVTCYELPCGVMEAGESPIEAAKRELLEETGYSGGEWQELMAISANPSTMTNITHCFLAIGVEKTSEQNLDATEELTVHLLDHETVRSLVEKGEPMQSLMIAPLLKHFSMI